MLWIKPLFMVYMWAMLRKKNDISTPTYSGDSGVKMSPTFSLMNQNYTVKNGIVYL